jgi:hypothetical protein
MLGPMANTAYCCNHYTTEGGEVRFVRFQVLTADSMTMTGRLRVDIQWQIFVRWS